MKSKQSRFGPRRFWWLATSALWLAASAPPALAVVAGPVVTVTADGTVYEIPVQSVSKVATGATGAAGSMAFEVQDYTIDVVGQYSFTIARALLDPDPSIAYSIAVLDFGLPTSFLFAFSTPIVPTGSPNVVSASLSGVLTDGGNDGVSITPLGARVQTSQVGSPLTSMGVDLDLNQMVGPLPGPVGTWDSLLISAGFTLSGGGDGASLSGFASINEGRIPVPEPASLALVGLALCAAASSRRRARRG